MVAGEEGHGQAGVGMLLSLRRTSRLACRLQANKPARHGVAIFVFAKILFIFGRHNAATAPGGCRWPCVAKATVSVALCRGGHLW